MPVVAGTELKVVALRTSDEGMPETVDERLKIADKLVNGLDGAIVNPLDKRMMANIIAAEAGAGRDGFCVNYLKAHRPGRFQS